MQSNLLNVITSTPPPPPPPPIHTQPLAQAKGIQVQPRYAVQRGATTGDTTPAASTTVTASGRVVSLKGKGKARGRGARGPSAEEMFPGTTCSYANFMRMEIVREIKVCVCVCVFFCY